MAVYYATQTPNLTPRVNFGWLGEAFQLFLAQAGNWIGAIFVSVLIELAVATICYILFIVYFASLVFYSIASSAHGFLAPAVDIAWVAMVAVSLAVQAFLHAGMQRMANAQVRGMPISVGMVFRGGPVYLRFVGFYIVYGILSTVGLVFFLIPGFICMGLIAPAFALIADGAPIGDAMKRSFHVVKRDWFMAGLFTLLLIVLWLVVGALTCTLGAIFVIMPMSMLVLTLAYRDMIGMPAAPAERSLANGGGLDAGPAQPGVWPPPPGASVTSESPDPANSAEAGYPNEWPPAPPLPAESADDPSGAIDRSSEPPVPDGDEPRD